MGALLGVDAEPICGIMCDILAYCLCYSVEWRAYCLCYGVEWRELAYGTRTFVDAFGINSRVCAYSKLS